MIIQCSKCKTSFNVDQNLISNEAKVYHCSVCKNEWSIEYDQSVEMTNDEKVKKGLEAIRTEVKKNTKILSSKNAVKSRDSIKVKNKSHTLKKKTLHK